MDLGISVARDWHGAAGAIDEPDIAKLKKAVELAFDKQSETRALVLAAGGTARKDVAKATARTLIGVRARVQVPLTSALGNITLAILDGDGVTLLASATIDAKTLGTAYTALTLTATTGLLALAAGEAVRIALVSTNGDAVGGVLTVVLDYA
jgi:hypothetical protein